MHPLIRRFTAAFFVISLVTILISCGGGGGGSDSAGTGGNVAEKGTVTLLVTDAPDDDFKEINLTVLKAELLCDDGRKELFSGEKEFDLLTLTNVTEIFSVSEVSAGFCSKIRLTLKQIELVFKDYSKAYPKIPGNGKLDLNPRERFYVGYEKPLAIQLDYDAKKSIHVVKTGNGKTKYNFRPVVFIKIVENQFDTKLIRQRGTVENLNGKTGEFDLCLIDAEIQPVLRHEDDDSSDDDSPDCIRVNTTYAHASIFDDQANRISFEELEEGEIATVVGRLSFYSSKSDDKSSDDGSSDDKSSDDGSSDDDSSDDNDRPRLVLVAEVIWTGNEITQTLNIACSDAMSGTYENHELPVPEGEEACVTPGSRLTFLQPGAGIYDSQGNALDESSIVKGVLNEVDAFGNINPKAVLVMLGLDNPLNPLDQLTGIIGDVDFNIGNGLSNLSLMTDGGDRCVLLDNAETKVFETRLDENDVITFSQMTVFSLKPGQMADVFGTENNGCLEADTIIYENNGAIIQPI